MSRDYIKSLSVTERAAAMKMGAMLHLGHAGAMDKYASIVTVSPGGIAKTIATLSIVAGIPLGIAAHVVNKRVSKRRAEEQELEDKIDYYRNASSGLETGLADQTKIAGLFDKKEKPKQPSDYMGAALGSTAGLATGVGKAVNPSLAHPEYIKEKFKTLSTLPAEVKNLFMSTDYDMLNKAKAKAKAGKKAIPSILLLTLLGGLAGHGGQEAIKEIT